MSNPHETPTNAWRWVLAMWMQYKSLPLKDPLKIAPVASLKTTRARLFAGRKYIATCPATSPLVQYNPPSNHISIQTKRFALELHAHDTFYWEWEGITPDDFLNVLEALIPGKVRTPTTLKGLHLSGYQTPVLKDYLSSIFAKVLVTTTFITVVPK